MEEVANETMAHVPDAESRSKKGMLAALSVSLIAFVVPVLVIPFTIAPIQFSKTMVVLVVTAILYGMFVLDSMRRGEIRKHWSLSLVTFALLPLVYLVTAIFSQSPERSFFGYRLETDTFGFIALAVLFTNVIVLSVKRSQLGMILKASLAAAWVVMVFQLVQVLSGAFTGSGVLGTVITNALGRWNDFGIFVGLAGSLSLLALFAVRLKGLSKLVLAATYLLTIFFLALVNFTEAWALFGMVSCALLVLLFVQMGSNAEEKIGFSAMALPALGTLVTVFFVFFGSGASAVLQDTFAVNAFEVRPSVSGTIEVLQHTYQNTPMLGSGPNTFSYEWLQHRNSGVLNTIFWNTEFNVGSGTIPTMFITGGAFTALVWIVFTVLLVITVFRALFITPVAGRMYSTVAISGVAVLYLLTVHYVYAPSQSLTLLFALALGVFFASIKETPLMRTVRFSVTSRHMRAAMMVGAVVVLVVGLMSVYGATRTYASALYHDRAIQVANAGDLIQGETLIRRAISLRPQDRYYRTAAQVNVAQLNQLVNGEEAPENAAQQFQDMLSKAVENAREAVTKDRASFQNWLTLASVYSSVVPFQIEGALENARASFEEARLRSPKSPEVDYRLAQLAMVADGDTTVARTYLEAALTKKQDYTQSILLLAQIELDAGNLKEAIESVRAAAYFEPNNAVLLYQLGILLLQDQNYSDAAIAFEAALGQQPDYSNAAFFLAQSYAFLDRLDEAAQLMRQVAERNPESELARTYADMLSVDTNPFDAGDVTSPEDEEDAVE